MLILILFLQGVFNNNLSLEIGYPVVNLSALHPGFLNPANSRGIVGMMTNPASICDIEGGEVFIAFTPTITSKVSTEFTIDVDTIGSIVDDLVVPVDFSLQDRGNVDLLAVGIRKDRWAFGFGFLRGDFLRFGVDADDSIAVHHEIGFEDTLTSELLEGLPQGVKIPVSILLSGSGGARLQMEGEAKMQSQSFILCAGRREAGLDVGFGLQVEPLSVGANAEGVLRGRLAAAANAQVNEHSSQWTIDAIFSGEIFDDSLYAGYLDTKLNCYLLRFMTGFKKNWRFLDVGFAYHLMVPTDFTGDIQYFLSQPDTAFIPEFEIEDEQLIIDTVNYRISGRGKILIKNFRKMTDEEYKKLKYSFAKTHGFYGGAAFNLFVVRLALFAGGHMAPDFSYSRLMGGLNLGILKPIPIDATVVLHSQIIKIDLNGDGIIDNNDIPFTSVPVISGNVGTNLKVKNVRGYLGVGLNSTQTLGSNFLLPYLVEELGAESKERRENIISVKFGLGYEF